MNIPALSAVAAAGSALFAAFTYFRNSATKRAEFLLSLHKTFFVETTYLEMREAMGLKAERFWRKVTTCGLNYDLSRKKFKS